MTVPMRSALRRIDIFEFPLLEPVTRLEALNRGSVLLLGELGSFHDGYITELGMTGMIHNYYFRHTSVIIVEVKCNRYVIFIDDGSLRSEEHTSELQSLMRISYAVFC